MPNLSFSLNFGVSLNDILQSFHDTASSSLKVIQNITGNPVNILNVFDMIMLRVIFVMILLSTIVLTILTIPHASLIVEDMVTKILRFCFSVGENMSSMNLALTPQNMFIINQVLFPMAMVLTLL